MALAANLKMHERDEQCRFRWQHQQEGRDGVMSSQIKNTGRCGKLVFVLFQALAPTSCSVWVLSSRSCRKLFYQCPASKKFSCVKSPTTPVVKTSAFTEANPPQQRRIRSGRGIRKSSVRESLNTSQPVSRGQAKKTAPGSMIDHKCTGQWVNC